MTTDNQTKEDFDRFLVCGPKPKGKVLNEKQLKLLEKIARKRHDRSKK